MRTTRVVGIVGGENERKVAQSGRLSPTGTNGFRWDREVSGRDSDPDNIRGKPIAKENGALAWLFPAAMLPLHSQDPPTRF